MLDEVIKTKMVEIIRKSDQIIAVKVVLEVSIASVVNVYALQAGCAEYEKNEFWQDMDEVIQEILEKKKILVGGDFNVHVKKRKQGNER